MQSGAEPLRCSGQRSCGVLFPSLQAVFLHVAYERSASCTAHCCCPLDCPQPVNSRRLCPGLPSPRAVSPAHEPLPPHHLTSLPPPLASLITMAAAAASPPTTTDDTSPFPPADSLERAVLVTGLAPATTEATLRDFFSFCGKLVALRSREVPAGAAGSPAPSMEAVLVFDTPHRGAPVASRGPACSAADARIATSRARRLSPSRLSRRQLPLPPPLSFPPRSFPPHPPLPPSAAPITYPCCAVVAVPADRPRRCCFVSPQAGGALPLQAFFWCCAGAGVV